jgi:divalent metal cation (Fe/Co/Zn/Cd) transporter
VPATSTSSAPTLLRRGLRLEYATLGWNLATVVVVLGAAAAARSVALAGFALDSGIEIFASVVVVWQLTGAATREREDRAVRLIGIAFLGLAVYLLAQTGITLAAGIRPAPSPVGIGLLAATTAVMFTLATAKARTGQALGNATLGTEARVTMLDGALAAAILIGLILNATMGWWWADLVAGGVIIGFGVREGAAALGSPT